MLVEDAGFPGGNGAGPGVLGTALGVVGSEPPTIPASGRGGETATSSRSCVGSPTSPPRAEGGAVESETSGPDAADSSFPPGCVKTTAPPTPPPMRITAIKNSATTSAREACPPRTLRTPQ